MMWNKPNLLNWSANLLFVLALLAMLYSALHVFMHLPIFPINEIKIEGRLKHIKPAQLNLITSKYLKCNFFTLDLALTRDAFENLIWARSVSVRRQWPDTILIKIEEQQPIARWANTGMVNQYGELFQGTTDEVLPVFYGPEDAVKEVTEGYLRYSKMLAQMNLSIAQVSLSTRRAWEINTTNHKTISLGRVDMENRLRRFIKANKHGSDIRSADWQYADLRYLNGFALGKKNVS